MKFLLLWSSILGGAAAGCSAPERAPIPELTSRPSEAPPPPAGADRIVAFLDGEPLTWMAVAEKAMELDLKDAVDRYVRWRVLEDRRVALGIRNAPGERVERAKVHVARLKERLGEPSFREQLAREGTTEDAYVARLAGSGLIEQMLTLDKIVRYDALRTDRVEIDRAFFVEAADAATFAAEVRDRGFDAAAQALDGAERSRRWGLFARETFARTRPPADPMLDAPILEKVLALPEGGTTGAEASRTNLTYVIRLRRAIPGREASYADVRAEILSGILKDPPDPREYGSWMEGALADRRVDYAAPGGGAGAP